jgi:histone deacetylase 11
MTGAFYFRNVKKTVRQVKPDLLVYNAGTDILEGDPLGILAISPYVMFL